MTDRLSWEREEKLVVSAWYEMVGGVPFYEFHTHTHTHTPFTPPLCSIGSHDAQEVFPGATAGTSHVISQSSESFSL